MVNCRLAVTGAHVSDTDVQTFGANVLSRAAGKITGPGCAIRSVIPHALVDTKSMANHYLLKAARMLDRILRSTGSSAQTNAGGSLRSEDSWGQ